MLLGIPVVATGWSGNVDFMDEASAALVKYRLVPVVDDLRHYSPSRFARQQLWAEPDVDDAAAHMTRLATDTRLRTELGEAGREHVTRYRDTWRKEAPQILANLYDLRRGR
jgi:glycosyltransferase involved in cell wall biosynthesis